MYHCLLYAGEKHRSRSRVSYSRRRYWSRSRSLSRSPSSQFTSRSWSSRRSSSWSRESRYTDNCLENSRKSRRHGPIGENLDAAANIIDAQNNNEAPETAQQPTEVIVLISTEEVRGICSKPIYSEREFAPEVAPDLAARWQEILVRGVPEDLMENLTKKHPPPKNCKHFDPPILNDVIRPIVWMPSSWGMIV